MSIGLVLSYMLLAVFTILVIYYTWLKCTCRHDWQHYSSTGMPVSSVEGLTRKCFNCDLTQRKHHGDWLTYRPCVPREGSGVVKEADGKLQIKQDRSFVRHESDLQDCVEAFLKASGAEWDQSYIFCRERLTVIWYRAQGTKQWTCLYTDKIVLAPLTGCITMNIYSSEDHNDD